MIAVVDIHCAEENSHQTKNVAEFGFKLWADDNNGQCGKRVIGENVNLSKLYTCYKGCGDNSSNGYDAGPEKYSTGIFTFAAD